MFRLHDDAKRLIHRMRPNFGYNGYGEFLFYRTYSRRKSDGSMESWHDTVIRVTEGTFDIRKDWYKKCNIPWDEDFWQQYAYNFAVSMFNMLWLPPGRGLWAMGTDYVREHGSMCLNNCGLSVVKNISKDVHWIMDALMNGVGVGFIPYRDDTIKLQLPKGKRPYVIEDSREGWCDSVRVLIDCYFTGEPLPIFDYSKIRPHGEPIKGFGGVASGPEPLMTLHKRIMKFMLRYMRDPSYDSLRLKADIVNCVGCCVVAGNVRRSAELMAGYIDDPVFLDLKNYDKYPERVSWGGMSNNSVFLEQAEDFEKLDQIATRVVRDGEPGYINLINLPKGRLGHDDGLLPDKAIGFNPCGEQPLEDKELCTLVETMPTRCKSIRQWYKALEYATVYASTVTLLPTHSEETNAVMLRNRRIGVGMCDVTGFIQKYKMNKVTRALREGYKIVRSVNSWVNSEAGVPNAIRVTTIKPGGTVPRLAGCTPGQTYPTYKETLRRANVAKDSALSKLLIEYGVPYEVNKVDPSSLLFEFPIMQDSAKPIQKASIWEQAMLLTMLQREWSDNAVSNTLYFKPKWKLIKAEVNNGIPIKDNQKIEPDKWGRYNLYEYDPNHEEDEVERVLAAIAPHTKSVSLMPYTDGGVYPQSPETYLSPEEYAERVKNFPVIDWSKLEGFQEVESDRYCTGDKCEIT